MVINTTRTKKKTCHGASNFCLLCAGEDLNLHARRHTHLKGAWLPITTPAHVNLLPREHDSSDSALFQGKTGFRRSSSLCLSYFYNRSLLWGLHCLLRTSCSHLSANLLCCLFTYEVELRTTNFRTADDFDFIYDW